jgi:hypothetical protein
MSDKRLIRSEIIPGKVDHFRALMQRLVIQYTQQWVSSEGRHLFFVEIRQVRDGLDVTPATRGSWSVFLAPVEGPGYAGIEAYELSGDRGTRIEFLDCYTPRSPKLNEPIGSAFEEFIDIVLRETVSDQRSRESAADHTDEASDLLPKTQSTRDKWKRIWAIILETQRKYMEEYENMNTDNPKPHFDDYRDAIASEIGWKPAAKTIRRIIHAGARGLLDD